MQKEKLSKIIDIINWGDSYFKEKGIPDSRLNIELLLCAVLECKRMNLYLNFDKPLMQKELDTLRGYVKRRATREPLQYILGESEFMGFQFKVNPSVLIPRPETELLVEEVINHSKGNNETNIKILDIGSGSGNISISLAKTIKNCSVTAIDSSQEAINTGLNNAVINSVTENTSFILFDILKDDICTLGIFDIIVSNPPYISIEEYHELEPELAYEPQNALTDLDDGLTFYRRIAEIGKTLLKPDGFFAVEIAYNQAELVSALFKNNSYKDVKVLKDYSNLDRIITGFHN